jgi:hypothetical protein
MGLNFFKDKFSIKSKVKSATLIRTDSPTLISSLLLIALIDKISINSTDIFGRVLKISLLSALLPPSAHKECNAYLALMKERRNLLRLEANMSQVVMWRPSTGM